MTRWLDAALDYLPQWLDYQVRETRQPGCAIAVAERGKTVLEAAFGRADVATGERLTPRHLFHVASHSKTFTAAGVMKLVERRALRLDAPVGRYVDGLHPQVAQATLRQLLSHGSGIVRDGVDSAQWQLARPFLTADELRADLRRAPTLRADVRFKYSNHAFGLLGFAIEAATGAAYKQWIHDEVIVPAGLTHTFPDVPVRQRLCNGHGRRDANGRRLTFGRDLTTHALASATGFVSTAGDLVRFFAHVDPNARKSFLSVASRRAMTRAVRGIPGVPAGREYGLGVIRGGSGASTWFGHSGGFPGYLTRTSMLPKLGVTISILTNSIDGPSQAWMEGAIAIVAAFASRGAPTKAVRGWTGRWRTIWNTCDLVPIGQRVLVANPVLAQPFLGASELTVRGDVGRISEADGFGSYGEPARLICGRSRRAVALELGGTRYQPE
jgi:D-alanyl-D-alanine carboxypeptidase